MLEEATEELAGFTSVILGLAPVGVWDDSVETPRDSDEWVVLHVACCWPPKPVTQTPGSASYAAEWASRLGWRLLFGTGVGFLANSLTVAYAGTLLVVTPHLVDAGAALTLVLAILWEAAWLWLVQNLLRADPPTKAIACNLTCQIILFQPWVCGLALWICLQPHAVVTPDFYCKYQATGDIACTLPAFTTALPAAGLPAAVFATQVVATVPILLNYLGCLLQRIAQSLWALPSEFRSAALKTDVPMSLLVVLRAIQSLAYLALLVFFYASTLAVAWTVFLAPLAFLLVSGGLLFFRGVDMVVALVCRCPGDTCSAPKQGTSVDLEQQQVRDAAHGGAPPPSLPPGLHGPPFAHAGTALNARERAWAEPLQQRQLGGAAGALPPAFSLSGPASANLVVEAVVVDDPVSKKVPTARVAL